MNEADKIWIVFRFIPNQIIDSCWSSRELADKRFLEIVNENGERAQVRAYELDGEV